MTMHAIMTDCLIPLLKSEIKQSLSTLRLFRLLEATAVAIDEKNKMQPPNASPPPSVAPLQFGTKFLSAYSDKMCLECHILSHFQLRMRVNGPVAREIYALGIREKDI